MRRSAAPSRGLKKLCASFPPARNVMREVAGGCIRHVHGRLRTTQCGRQVQEECDHRLGSKSDMVVRASTCETTPLCQKRMDAHVVEALFIFDGPIAQHLRDGPIVQHLPKAPILQHVLDGRIAQHLRDGPIAQHL